MKDRTSVQSAALALAHEMGHGAQLLDGYRDGKKSEWRVEANNLRLYEKPIARELGEPTRVRYGATSGRQTMNNPLYSVLAITLYSPVTCMCSLSTAPKNVIIRNLVV